MSDGMNDIQYGAYRTAMKLRAVQKACGRKLQSWKDTVIVICLLNNYSFGTLASFLLITRSCTIGIVHCKIKSVVSNFLHFSKPWITLLTYSSPGRQT